MTAIDVHLPIDTDRDVVRKSLVAGLLIDVGNAGTIISVAAVNRKPVGRGPFAQGDLLSVVIAFDGWRAHERWD